MVKDVGSRVLLLQLYKILFIHMYRVNSDRTLELTLGIRPSLFMDAHRLAWTWLKC